MTCPCGLDESGFVSGIGPAPCRIMLVGEAPGATEVRRGLPFCGPSGQLLTILLAEAGLLRTDVYITNAVKCRPPMNRKPTPTECRECFILLREEMDTVDPKVVITLGDTALQVLSPGTTLKTAHGLPLKRAGYSLVPMYHPAAALHNPSLRATLLSDWKSFGDKLVQAVPHGTEVKVITWGDYHAPGEVEFITSDVPLALDTETDFLGGDLLAVSLCGKEGEAVVIKTPGAISLEAPLVICHNLKYDMKAVRQAGLDLGDGRPVADTMIAYFLVGEDRLGLKPLALKRLGVEMATLGPLLKATQDEMTKEFIEGLSDEGLSKTMAKSLAEVKVAPNPATALARRSKLRSLVGNPPEASIRSIMERKPDEFTKYSAADADMTLRLWNILEPEMKEKGVDNLFWQVEMPLVHVLADMEDRGMAVDKCKVGRLLEVFGHRASVLHAQMERAVGEFDPNSSQQVVHILYDVLGLPVLGRTDGGAPTTAKWALERLAEDEEVVEQLLDYRMYTKLMSTYLTKWLRGGDRIHPSFNQVSQRDEEDAEGATATGRLSSSGPNFQNIPKHTEAGMLVRSCIVAPPGKVLVAVDLSQIELVVAAILSEEPSMLDALWEKADLHRRKAAQIFGVSEDEVQGEMRSIGKTINFSWIYGIRAPLLARRLKVSISEAQRFLTAFEASSPRLRAWWYDIAGEAQRKGYAVTKWGRRRYLPELVVAQNQQEWYEGAKKAASMAVQGTVADMAKAILVGLDKALPDVLVCQVHDEDLGEFAVDDPRKEEMLPLVVSLAREGWGKYAPLINAEKKEGVNWAELH